MIICTSASVERQFDNQEMSVDELSQFKAQQTDLEKQMENISVQGAELDSDIWDAEIKKTQHLQEVRSYHTSCRERILCFMSSYCEELVDVWQSSVPVVLLSSPPPPPSLLPPQ